MATIGSYFSEPNGRFAVNRAYITHMVVKQNHDNYPPTFGDRTIRWPSVNFPNIVQWLGFLPQWIEPSSNTYSLDAIIQEYFYQVLPSPTPIPNSGLVLRYVWSITLSCMVLEVEKEAADTEAIWDLAGGAGGYWLDPVPS